MVLEKLSRKWMLGSYSTNLFIAGSSGKVGTGERWVGASEGCKQHGCFWAWL